MSTVSSARKRRGQVRSSITRLLNKLSNLELKAAEATTFDLATDILDKLAKLDKEFKTLHYQVLEHINEDDEEGLTKEQEELDAHDDAFDDAMIRVKQLATLSSRSANSSKRQSLTSKQSQLEKAVVSLCDTASPLTSDSDTHLIRQCEERLQQHKSSLKELSDNLLAMKLEDTDELCTYQDRLDALLYECDKIKKLGGANFFSP